MSLKTKISDICHYWPILKRKLLKLKTYIVPKYLFTLSMMLIAVGLSTSNTLMSIGSAGLIIAWLWNGHFKASFHKIKHDKRVLAFVMVYLLFVLGMIHTQNWAYGIHDLKVKLPLLILPPVMVTFYPFDRGSLRWILHSIYLGVFISIVTGLLIYLGWIPWKVIDMRSYSPFISNVRLGTILVFTILLSAYFLINGNYRLLPKAVYLFFIFINLGFLLVIQSLTGIVALIGCLTMVAIFSITQNTRRKVGLLFLSLLILITTPILIITKIEYNRVHNIEKIDFSQLPYSTVHGAIYKHDTLSTATVNGHYVWINVCNWELKREWEKRSTIVFDGSTKNGWPIRNVLISYITSKGLKKNAEAVIGLSDKEIAAIENGADNFLRVHPLDFRWRIHQQFVELEEYQQSGDPNNKSFATRLETWKIASKTIAKSPILGHGTGDVNDQMKLSYIEFDSKLDSSHQYNPHQQILSGAIAIGIPGAIILIILLFLPIFKLKKLDILFLGALTIFFIGMMDEDMLETQAGTTQFVFIYLLTYLMNKERLSNT